MFAYFLLLSLLICVVYSQGDEHYKELMNWVNKNGGKIDSVAHGRVGIREFLLSTKNRDYGSVLCEIPMDLVICKETILKIPFFSEYKDLDEKVLIIAFIHYAYFYNKNTPFAPFINSLDMSLRSPFIYSNENKEMIKSVLPVFDYRLNEINKNLNLIYSTIIMKHPEVYNASDIGRITAELTSSITVEEIQSFSDIQGYEGKTVLIPILADTREVYSSFTPIYNKEKKTFSSKIRFTPNGTYIGITHLNDPMECDIESFINYNQIPDVGIPCADIVILPEYREGERIVESKRRKAYVRLGISDSTENVLYKFRLSIHNPLPNKLLMYARLYAANDFNIDDIVNEPYQPVSIENEYRALKFLRKELMKIEDGFPTTLEYDQKKLSEITVNVLPEYETRETLRFVVGFKSTIREALNEIEKRWERLLYADL